MKNNTNKCDVKDKRIKRKLIPICYENALRSGELVVSYHQISHHHQEQSHLHHVGVCSGADAS